MIGKFSLLNKLTFSTLGNCFASLSFPSWSYPNWYPQSSSHCFAISDSFLTCSCQIFVWIYLFENFLVSYSGAHLGVILNTSLTLSNILPSEFVKKCWIGLSNKRVLSAEDKISRVWQLSLYDAPLFTATFLTSRINCHHNPYYFRTVRPSLA